MAMEKNKIGLRERDRMFGILIICIVCSMLVANLFVGEINMIDEGQYGSWVYHMLQGKKMYQDIYITYGPMAVYPLYLLATVFSPSAFLVRLFLSGGTVVGLGAIYLLSSLLVGSRKIRLILLLLCSLLPVVVFRQGIGFFCLYFLFLAIRTKKTFWWFVTGLLCALSFLISAEIGIFLGTILCLVFVSSFFKRDKTISLKQIGAILSGIFMVIIPFALWALGEGWLFDYLKVTSDVLTIFSGINLPNGQGLPNVTQLVPQTFSIVAWTKFIFSKELLFFWGLAFYFFTLLYLFVQAFLKRFSRKDVYILCIVVFGLELYSILLGRSGIGHFFFVLSPIVLISGFFVEKLLTALYEKGENFTSKVIAFGIVLTLVFFGLRLLFINRLEVSRHLRGLFVLHLSENREIGPLSISYEQEQQIFSLQKFVTNNVAKKDYVFFLSNTPAMYLFVDRKNPTRYDLPYLAVTKEKRYEMYSELVKKMPKYIFYDPNEWAIDGISTRDRLPEVSAFISEYYSLEKTIAEVEVYRVKTGL